MNAHHHRLEVDLPKYFVSVCSEACDNQQSMRWLHACVLQTSHGAHAHACGYAQSDDALALSITLTPPLRHPPHSDFILSLACNES